MNDKSVIKKKNHKPKGLSGQLTIQTSSPIKLNPTHKKISSFFNLDKQTEFKTENNTQQNVKVKRIFTSKKSNIKYFSPSTTMSTISPSPETDKTITVKNFDKVKFKESPIKPNGIPKSTKNTIQSFALKLQKKTFKPDKYIAPMKKSSPHTLKVPPKSRHFSINSPTKENKTQIRDNSYVKSSDQKRLNKNKKGASKLLCFSFHHMSECDDLVSGEDIPKEMRKKMLISRDNVISIEKEKSTKRKFKKKISNALKDIDFDLIQRSEPQYSPFNKNENLSKTQLNLYSLIFKKGNCNHYRTNYIEKGRNTSKVNINQNYWAKSEHSVKMNNKNNKNSINKTNTTTVNLNIKGSSSPSINHSRCFSHLTEGSKKQKV